MIWRFKLYLSDLKRRRYYWWRFLSVAITLVAIASLGGFGILAGISPLILALTLYHPGWILLYFVTIPAYVVFVEWFYKVLGWDE